MRHLISTLQTHNQQMKGEVVKYKIRLRETQAELNQVGHKEMVLSSRRFDSDTSDGYVKADHITLKHIHLLPL